MGKKPLIKNYGNGSGIKIDVIVPAKRFKTARRVTAK
jgi:hypothetical protein